MAVDIGWPLAVAVVLLVLLGMTAGVLGRLQTRWEPGWAAVRAAVQLLIVSLVVGLALRSPWQAWSFVSAMFVIGVITSSRRAQLKSWRAQLAAALTMGAGAAPVLLIIFGSGAAPWSGEVIVPVGSILVGNMMTAHTLIARRCFAELRSSFGQYEALLALGFTRPAAISLLLSHCLHEGLLPALDQTKTVGLVTLPGAFVGIVLAGGSVLQAAAAQVLVLVGVNAGQACAALAARILMAKGQLLPADLYDRLHV